MPETPLPIGVVCYVPGLDLGGTETQLLKLVTQLPRSRFNTVVWCSGTMGRVADQLKLAGVPVYSLGIRASDPLSIVRAVEWLRSLRPLIFHSFGYATHFIDIVAARLAGIPTCIVSRGDTRFWDTAGQVTGWELIRNTCTDVVIANARAIAEVCQKVEHIPTHKLRVLHNGVAMPELRRDMALRHALSIPDDAPVIGCVANLRPVKGHSFLIEAFAAVKREVERAFLVICGEGKERTRLERLCAEMSLQDSVFLPGTCTNTEAVYRAIDIYVQASLSEGLSNSLLEAMSYGLPVVATDVGGTAECLTHGVTGLLVGPGESRTLGSAILALLKDERERVRLGSAARSAVTQSFSIDRMVAEHEKIYLECAGPGNGCVSDRGQG